ncbi:hypothetical protein BDP27DRAFT_612952 [Rhodocollybia butyracea]|uniref:Uncharacterized protein n=1 Tax=Rhodocollybia butyracea TaxID=206335 RepID=A0A9P5PV25_9AGAR|nr:hypothetical protein BDP27DRAFT_612952 [Rhodocollybia butyracea]
MSTTKFSKLLEWHLSPSTCGHMIMGSISTICSFAVINQLFATCSLDVLQSPSLLAPAAFLLAGVITPHYRLAHKAYATMTQYIHIRVKDHLVLSFLHNLTLHLLPVVALLALVYMTYLLVYHMVYTLINPPYTCHSMKFAFGIRGVTFLSYALTASSHWFMLFDLYLHSTRYTYTSQYSDRENILPKTAQEIVVFKNLGSA